MPLPKIRKLALCVSLAAPLLFSQNPQQPGQLPGPFVPLTNSEKFKYRIVKTVALRGIIGAGLGAGFQQLIDSPPEWEGGVEGYAKRYGSAFGQALIRQTLNFGFEAALNEDPRYFPLDGPDKKARVWNALKQTFLTRTDTGATTFAYGRVGSAFATGQIARTWLPPSNNSFADGVGSAGISLGIDTAVNFLYEFVPRVRPKQIGKCN